MFVIAGITAIHQPYKEARSTITYYRPTNSRRWQSPRDWGSTLPSPRAWPRPRRIRVPDTYSTPRTHCPPTYIPCSSHRHSLPPPTSRKSHRSTAVWIQQVASTLPIRSVLTKPGHINTLRSISLDVHFIVVVWYCANLNLDLNALSWCYEKHCIAQSLLRRRWGNCKLTKTAAGCERGVPMLVSIICFATNILLSAVSVEVLIRFSR